MTTDSGVTTVIQLLLAVFVVLVPIRLYGSIARGLSVSKFVFLRGHPTAKRNVRLPESERVPLTVRPVEARKDPSAGLHFYKELYHKLQNLENHPQILPKARDCLVSLLAETLGKALSSDEPGILAIERYSEESLSTFLQKDNEQVTRQWEAYVARRRAGSEPELFQSREEAKWWLKQLAPVKYVDGAWLGHINKITTPFAFRKATKDAWQVMSEELGDGNPELNHVYVYQRLMEDIGADLPDADTIDFIHERHQLNDEKVWKAAVAQLLISLFPHEFLPEILGFNLHFEGLTMETMKAGKELEEFGLNPYYFILHISIDNADSGHTAIAMHAVRKYLSQITQISGDDAAQATWKRVQAGFILSKELSHGPQHPSRKLETLPAFPRDKIEAAVIRVFKAKVPVAYKLHCSSRIKFGGRQLDDWFEPGAFASQQWQKSFLDHLGNLRPWVRKGDSDNSRLMHELQWGGKMFGSFTQNEVEAVRAWIDALGPQKPQLYWTFTGRDEVTSEAAMAVQDIRVDCPVFDPKASNTFTAPSKFSQKSQLLRQGSATTPHMAHVLPLWFTSPCLLESFVSIPAKTTSIAVSAVVRLLRAQCGFDHEGLFVAGMDEVRRTDSSGLMELGLEMMNNLRLDTPASLKDVLDAFPSDFAVKMLEMSVRPMANKGLLLGLTEAFVGLHEAMSCSPLLSPSSRLILQEIIQREKDCLKLCLQELKNDIGAEKGALQDFHRGHELGRAEIATCFQPASGSTEGLPLLMAMPS